MTTHYIAKGTVLFRADISKKILEIVFKEFKRHDEFYNISKWTREITFELSGENGIDYEPVKAIQKYMNKIKIKHYELFTNEFSEAMQGYSKKKGKMI